MYLYRADDGTETGQSCDDDMNKQNFIAVRATQGCGKIYHHIRPALENFVKMNLSEMAFVGLSAANRMIAKVLMKTGKSPINGDFFKNYEDAVKWLKSKR